MNGTSREIQRIVFNTGRHLA